MAEANDWYMISTPSFCTAANMKFGHKWHEAVWMITLVIAQLETELRWLEKLERDLGRRQKAMHPPRS